MNSNTVRLHDTDTRTRTADIDAATARVVPLLPGLRVAPGDAVSIPLPGISARADEAAWKDLLSDPKFASKRRGLLAQIRALLTLHAASREKGVSIAEEARLQGTLFRKTWEAAVVSLLEQNRPREEAVRSLALFFSNLQESASQMRGKIYAIDATGEELTTESGLAWLAGELKKYVRRPDPRASRGYLVVPGWVGSSTAKNRLSRVVHDHRALLITDAPAYDHIDKLRDAARDGGLLEEIPGEEIYHRHTIMFGNRGRARTRFTGRHAAEKRDVLIPLSTPWFGQYMDRIVRGQPWRPPLGYMNPVAGIDSVELDLLLEEHDGFSLFSRHRINPCIRLSADSRQIVAWGPDTTSKNDGGVQIGVAVVEMILIRYAEWIINQYGLLDDLEKSEEIVGKKLGTFMVMNSGAGRMFLAGSRIQVQADARTRTLQVEFHVRFREVAERAQIRLVKPIKADPGSVVATSSRA
jgi:hypothetical protein